MPMISNLLFLQKLSVFINNAFFLSVNELIIMCLLEVREQHSRCTISHDFIADLHKHFSIQQTIFQINFINACLVYECYFKEIKSEEINRHHCEKIFFS